MWTLESSFLLTAYIVVGISRLSIVELDKEYQLGL